MGATFDYHVGTIGPGESVTFAIYYGAAPDEATARQNLWAHDIWEYVLAESSDAAGPRRDHTVFFFGMLQRPFEG